VAAAPEPRVALMGISIALDCMGGDHGAHVTVPAAASFLAHNPEASVILVGQEGVVRTEMARVGLAEDARARVHNATEVVAMDEAIAVALRSKRDSSMRVAIDLVKNGDADACVSAGNTGALMAISRFVLKMLPGVERPAIASMMPTRRGRSCVLDLGANVDCSAVDLLQFAIMGSVLFGVVEQVEKPSVGLLNIGEEEIKGNDVVKQAAELLKASELNFYGNVEGNDIYKGTTDVIVCDGFVGNVALKTSEGVGRFVRDVLRESLTRTVTAKVGALLSRQAFNAFRRRLDYTEYGGAPLLGVRGICIIGHGSSNDNAIYNGIRVAYEFAKAGTNERIEHEFAKNHGRQGESSSEHDATVH
jgi:glycerol-3-phosphate acyltransferase PlsX